MAYNPPDRSATSIDRVALALKVALNVYPDQRVGQLISNALVTAGRSSDPFHIENDDLAEALYKYSGHLGSTADVRGTQVEGSA